MKILLVILLISFICNASFDLEELLHDLESEVSWSNHRKWTLPGMKTDLLKKIKKIRDAAAKSDQVKGECPEWKGKEGVPNSINEQTHKDNRRNLIVNGGAADRHEYPWTVKIDMSVCNYGRSFICTGSIISREYILTAAHCPGFPNALKPGDLRKCNPSEYVETHCADEGGECSCKGKVFYGYFGYGKRYVVEKNSKGKIACTNDAFGRDPYGGMTKECRCVNKVGSRLKVQLAHGTVKVTAREWILHKDWKGPGETPDVALLRVDPIPCGNQNIRPIPVLESQAFNFDGCTAFTQGYGATQTLHGKKDVNVPVVWDKYDVPGEGVMNELVTKVWKGSNEGQCGKPYIRVKLDMYGNYEDNPIDTDIYMCTNTADQSEQTCDGDSGGPVTIDTDKSSSKHKYAQLGVTSFARLNNEISFFGGNQYTKCHKSKGGSWQTNLLAPTVQKFLKDTAKERNIPIVWKTTSNCDKAHHHEGFIGAKCNSYFTHTKCYDLHGGRGYLNDNARCRGKRCTNNDKGICCRTRATSCLKRHNCCNWGTSCKGCKGGDWHTESTWPAECISSRRCTWKHDEKWGPECELRPGQCCVYGSNCSGCPWGEQWVNMGTCGTSRRCKLAP